MSRKKMAEFKVCKNYTTILQADGHTFEVPKGSFYGRKTLKLLKGTYESTYWCIKDKTMKIGKDRKTGLKYCYVELWFYDKSQYRWRKIQLRNSLTGAWAQEMLAFIAVNATPEDVAMPIEYNKYKGLHDLHAESVQHAQSLRKKKIKAIKVMSKNEAKNNIEHLNKVFSVNTFEHHHEDAQETQPMSFGDWLWANR